MFHKFEFFLGTVWDLSDPLEGASTAANLLKELGKQVVYVTNNSSRSGPEIDRRFKELDFNANFVSPLLYSALLYIRGTK